MYSMTVNKVIASIVSILVVFLISHFLKKKAKNISNKKKIKKTRYFAMRRFISLLSLSLSGVFLIMIWGVDIKNMWVSITGVLAMIAVAFFAIWSLIGNILAGLILYFTAPFKIDDIIEILPDEIKGKVLAINTFYTIIAEEDDNYINIPNSLFFQKYIRKIRKK